MVRLDGEKMEAMVFSICFLENLGSRERNGLSNAAFGWGENGVGGFLHRFS